MASELSRNECKPLDWLVEGKEFALSLPKKMAKKKIPRENIA